MSDEIAADVAAVQDIGAVPTILDVVCRLTGMGFAAIARVTESRWVACQVLDNIDFGLQPGGELKVETTLCHEVRQSRDVIVFEDAETDPTYCTHHTPRIYGLKSYISMPIVLPDGQFFGTLCAIDPRPNKLKSPEVLGTFKLFAELIAYHLDAEQKVRRSSSDLLAERETAELREQFIAVLGHDLRNPLSALEAGTNTLMREGWTDRSPRVLSLMRGSIKRAQALVDNVMDLARARLGGGLVLEVDAERDLEETLMGVVDEIRASHPSHQIEAAFDFAGPVPVDHLRIAQMVSNLLFNAVAHGEEERPIRVLGRSDSAALEVGVRNEGTPIAPDAKEGLFKPFFRGDGPNRQGLGLGLYIASEIAQAHGGRIDVASDEIATQFTFHMPLARRIAEPAPVVQA